MYVANRQYDQEELKTLFEKGKKCTVENIKGRLHRKTKHWAYVIYKINGMYYRVRYHQSDIKYE